MAEYATDEEQVEAIKKWWSENGYYLVGGIVLGLGLLVGWNYWKGYKVELGEGGSAVYSQLANSQNANAEALLSELEADFSGTPYLTLGLLQSAKDAVEKKDWATAESELRKAAEAGGDLNVTEVARLRLARVLLASGNSEGALSEASKVNGAAFLSLREEIRGDALVAAGKPADAREAYDKALLSAGGRAEFLQLKRDNLGTGKAGS